MMIAVVAFVIIVPLDYLADGAYIIFIAMRGDWPVAMELYSEMIDDAQSDGGTSPVPIHMRVVIAVGYLALQAVALAGIGSVRITRTKTRRSTQFVALSTFAFMLAGLTVAVSLTLFELIGVLAFVDEHGGGWGTRPWAVAVLFASWAVWTVIGIAVWILRDGQTWIGCFVKTLIVGSWLEFLAALSLDIGLRDKDDSCPCAYGSWVSLMIVVPLLIWSCGPALLMIYLRERKLASENPARTRRILSRKTTRSGVLDD